jgi:hypothetical protein
MLLVPLPTDAGRGVSYASEMLIWYRGTKQVAPVDDGMQSNQGTELTLRGVGIVGSLTCTLEYPREVQGASGEAFRQKFNIIDLPKSG